MGDGVHVAPSRPAPLPSLVSPLEALPPVPAGKAAPPAVLPLMKLVLAPSPPSPLTPQCMRLFHRIADHRAV